MGSKRLASLLKLASLEICVPLETGVPLEKKRERTPKARGRTQKRALAEGTEGVKRAPKRVAERVGRAGPQQRFFF
jgi:hypothetical protein